MDKYIFPARTSDGKLTHIVVEKNLLDNIRTSVFDFRDVKIEAVEENGAPHYLLFTKAQARAIGDIYQAQGLVPLSGDCWRKAEEPEPEREMTPQERRAWAAQASVAYRLEAWRLMEISNKLQREALGDNE